MSEDPFEPPPSDVFLERLLDAILVHAPDEGWTPGAMQKAALTGGLSLGEVMLAAPRGVVDLLDAFARRAASAAGGQVRHTELSGMKVRERVKTGVLAWIAFLALNRRSVVRAAGAPANILTGPRGLWLAADAIWSALGDTSTDFNWYTKRATLSGVLGATFTAWVGTEDEMQLSAFLDRRLADVMKFEALKKRARDVFAHAPNPMDLFGQRR